MKEKKLVPNRRFEEFRNTDVWEQSKLSDVTNLIDGDRGNNYPSGADFSNQGHTLFLSAANVTKNGFLFESEYYITEEKSNALGNGKIELNDIVLTSRGSIGHVAWYNNNIKPLIPFARINSGMLILRSKEDVEPSYIEQYLKSPLGKRQIDLISFGSAQPQLTKKDVSNYKIPIPVKKEQAKLGEFFHDIDRLITFQQRKLEKTKALKSAYLAEMFPAEGERVPKRRFTGYTGNWEQSDLQGICSVFKDGDWIESKDQSNDGFRLIQTGNIGITNFIEKSKSKKWISKETFKKLNCNEVFPGDILISRLPEPAGRACIIPKLKTKMITSVDCTIVRTSDNYSADFLVQYLCTSKYFKEVTNLLGGGTRQRISRSALSVIKISAPNSLEEQQKIGGFFKKLDDSIDNQQQKLDKLKAMKQAYLQEMFV